MVVNVWGAENVHPARVAVTVYVFPPARENEKLPLESVSWLTVAPPVMLTVAPESAPPGPVHVPEMVNNVSALALTLTSSLPPDDADVQPNDASDARQAEMTTTSRNDRDGPIRFLIMFLSIGSCDPAEYVRQHHYRDEAGRNHSPK
jgi:hypothetical protein